MLAKNLFLWDKKKKENMWLVCAAVDNNFDLKDLSKHLGVGSGNLRGADEDVMSSLLGCKKGMVNLFAMLNDADKKVKVILDQRLADADWVSFHPMDNTASTAVSREGLQKLRAVSGRDDATFEVLDFASISSGAAGGAPTGDKAKKGGQAQGVKLTAEEKKKKKELEQAQKTEGIHELSIQYKKDVNFSKWYQEVITKSDMIEYYDISGCYILRPRAYFIWDKIQCFLNEKFAALGVDNCYFPMFVSKSALETEKDHVEGFSPEVAWVTKSGQSDLDEPIAIRPTSETIMYPSFAKWIHSHRDLPLLLNQWSNVVRWEFKHPTPFVRTREFLWQEGHTAHDTEADATKMVMNILDAYAKTYEELLAVPVVKGTKSIDERFAGAYFTTTTEIYVPVSGRGIQGATSHQLGQNFSKMFKIYYLDNANEKQLVWQTSWGLSTRSIGAMIMVHSDDMGMVLPPKVAHTQVVIIAIEKVGEDEANAEILKRCAEAEARLKAAGIRAVWDNRDVYKSGWKFNHWEQRGVPVRLELGRKDLEANEFRCAKRHDGVKLQLKQDDLVEQVKQLLETIHQEMYAKALEARQSHVKDVDNWADFMTALNGRNICMTPWCDVQQCEVDVKEKSKEESLQAMEEAGEGEVMLTGSAKTLCIPHEQPPLKEGAKCFACGQPAKVTALWGRSF